ncbi:hypothetical protein OG21DRAFT_1482907 [Imleria badia]|nr:hypothetical protein OG21DRAFT_1482907 [Imleria badia]
MASKGKTQAMYSVDDDRNQSQPFLSLYSTKMLLSGLLSFVVVILGLSTVQRMLTRDPVLGPPSTDPACSNPPMGQCAFYANCIESRYQCGPTGYPIADGQHFCQKFSDNRTMLDARGQQWMIDTMHCLQLAVVPDAMDVTPPAVDCQALKDQAFASHPGCYINNGFCTLSVQDWGAVVEILGMATFSTWDAFKGAVETAMECAEFYAYTVERELF